mmetsp:Transcript_17842/g.42813  ORF Transcript_17842/g.42813 Transcript_17842/m.42813 type:complete len:216 (-) Transcript_17842:254-901(-)
MKGGLEVAVGLRLDTVCLPREAQGSAPAVAGKVPGLRDGEGPPPGLGRGLGASEVVLAGVVGGVARGGLGGAPLPREEVGLGQGDAGARVGRCPAAPPGPGAALLRLGRVGRGGAAGALGPRGLCRRRRPRRLEGPLAAPRPGLRGGPVLRAALAALRLDEVPPLVLQLDACPALQHAAPRVLKDGLPRPRAVPGNTEPERLLLLRLPHPVTPEL